MFRILFQQIYVIVVVGNYECFNSLSCEPLVLKMHFQLQTNLFPWNEKKKIPYKMFRILFQQIYVIVVVRNYECFNSLSCDALVFKMHFQLQTNLFLWNLKKKKIPYQMFRILFHQIHVIVVVENYECFNSHRCVALVFKLPFQLLWW